MRPLTSAAIAWLAEHAPEHGFTLSYPRQAAHHRLSPRAWHIRYVGLNWRGSLSRGLILEKKQLRTQPSPSRAAARTVPRRLPAKECGAVTSAGMCQGVLSFCRRHAGQRRLCALSGRSAGRRRRCHRSRPPGRQTPGGQLSARAKPAISVNLPAVAR